MTADNRDSVTPLSRVWEDLVDDVQNAPDEQIIETCRKEGVDPAVVAARTKEQLLTALSSVGREKFLAARRRIESDESDLISPVDLPTTAEEKRVLLMSVLERRPEAGQAITIQNREYSSLSDEEVEMYLQQLLELGVDILDDEKE